MLFIGGFFILRRNFMDTDLRSARKDAGLTLKEVASMFGLSREWLRLVEKGSLVIAPERKEQIAQVISRLGSLTAKANKSVETGLQKIRARVHAPTAHQFRNPKPKVQGDSAASR
jgi:transcriptional regulator with XRE-family HTH domain